MELKAMGWVPSSRFGGGGTDAGFGGAGTSSKPVTKYPLEDKSFEKEKKMKTGGSFSLLKGGPEMKMTGGLGMKTKKAPTKPRKV